MPEFLENDRILFAKLDRRGEGASRVYRLGEWTHNPNKHVVIRAKMQEELEGDFSPTQNWYLDRRFYKPKTKDRLVFPDRVIFQPDHFSIRSTDDNPVKVADVWRVFPIYMFRKGELLDLRVGGGEKSRHRVIDIFDGGVELLVEAAGLKDKMSWPIQIPGGWTYFEKGDYRKRVVEIPGIIGVAPGGSLNNFGMMPDYRTGYVTRA